MNSRNQEQVGGFQKTSRQNGYKPQEERNKGKKFNKPRHSDKRNVNY